MSATARKVGASARSVPARAQSTQQEGKPIQLAGQGGRSVNDVDPPTPTERPSLFAELCARGVMSETAALIDRAVKRARHPFYALNALLTMQQRIDYRDAIPLLQRFGFFPGSAGKP